jgi:hypothetical protein
MARSLNPNRTDVLEGAGAVHGVVTVSTSPIEIKVGVNRLGDRQAVMVYNDGAPVIYYAPNASVASSGANKGFPLKRDQFVILPIGNIAWYYIAASTNTAVIVSELP